MADNSSLLVTLPTGGVDYLIRLSTWGSASASAGPGPYQIIVTQVASGACCTTAGDCFAANSVTCTGTSTLVANAACAPYPCTAPAGAPANNLCENATVVPPAASTGIVGTIVNASAEGSGCGSSTLPTGKDVFYSCTPTVSGNYRIGLCNSAVNWDTVISVHTGCPATSANVISGACADGGCATGAHGLISSVALTAGTTYIIRAAGFSNSTTGVNAITLDINQLHPNDNCSGAVTIAPGATVVGDDIFTTNESPTPPTCNGLSTFNLGVWYTFVAPTSNRYEITTCNSSTNFNTRVYAFRGTCAALTCVNAATAATPTCAVRSDAATVQFCATAGATYYFLVTNDTSGTGVFGLPLNDLGPVCVPPANDLCTGATTISTFPFTDNPVVEFATDDADVGCNSTTATAARAGVWYKLTTTEPGTLALNETSSADIVSTVYTGSCGSLTEVFCGDAEPSNFTAAANTTYYILYSLFSPTATPSTYAIAINFTPAPGACCNGVSCSIVNGASACTGTYLGAGSTCGGDPLPQNTNSTTVAIPDFTGADGDPAPTPVSTSVNVTDTSAITDLQVVVGINHTFVGDLWLRLRGPNGTVVDLFKRPTLTTCTTGALADSDDIVGTYTFSDAGATTIFQAATTNTSAIPPGVYKPSTCGGAATSLNTAYAGIPANGTWTLLASDEDQAITGSITSFAVVVNNVRTPGACDTPPTTLCCRGSLCETVAAGSCTVAAGAAAGAATPAGASCNATGNNTAPCCKADYNKQGGVELLDIFAFLNDWFNGRPYADFNGQNNVDLLDIFAFLNAWFAGGC